MVFGGEVEGGELGLEKCLVEFLLFQDAGDIAEVALVLGLFIEAELVDDDVFGGGEGDLAGLC